MMHRWAGVLLAGCFAATPALAQYGPGLATIEVENDLFRPLSVYIDGDYITQVRAGGEVDLRVRAGTRAIRLIQEGRTCVLSADVLELPRGAVVSYDIDRGCQPVAWRTQVSWSWGYGRGVWTNPGSRWRPDVVVVDQPRAVRVQSHQGPCREPVVVTRGASRTTSRSTSVQTRVTHTDTRPRHRRNDWDDDDRWDDDRWDDDDDDDGRRRRERDDWGDRRGRDRDDGNRGRRGRGYVDDDDDDDDRRRRRVLGR